MDGVNNLITRSLELYHSKRQEIASSTLNSRLENTTANQGVSSPLPTVGVLAMNSHPHLLTTPWCGEQLELWPLPTDQST